MILISPFSKKLSDGSRNPKDYPWWNDVVSMLKRAVDADIIQIGIKGEDTIGAHKVLMNRPFSEINELVMHCQTWASVDNFFPHFCRMYYPWKAGVVIYGPSDPDIFGYPHNVNLLKGREFLRERQFEKWTQCDYREERFVDAQVVATAILNLAEGARCSL